MKEVRKLYFGPARSVTILHTPTASEEMEVHLVDPGFSVDVTELGGFTEAQIHSFIRIKDMLARVPMPEIPVEKMDGIEKVLSCLFAILDNGKLDLGDIEELVELVSAAVKLVK